MKKAVKIFSRFLMVVLATILVFIIGYVAYMNIQFYRIEDDISIDIVNNQDAILDVTKEYTIVTYNIGFGAYNHDFSFFMDSGEMLTGEKVTGTFSKAESKEVVLYNTFGAIAVLLDIEPDFIFLQEVDIKSTRSHKINQYDAFVAAFKDYGTAFASNFHSSYLLYPLNDFHGSVNSGIATFSRFNILESKRYQLPIDMGFLAKFFDLDRAFQVLRIKTSNNKDLVLINVHLSAYDEGGKIRAQQLAVLNHILEQEQGNYVIVGGDFNHDIANSINLFPTTQKVPEWVFVIEEDSLPLGYRFATANNVGTCRSTDIPYQKGVNYTVVIDGFIVSSNITTTFIENYDNDFVFSDHNPVELRFKLQA